MRLDVQGGRWQCATRVVATHGDGCDGEGGRRCV
uniref:Uncharacterized protein n=1 Tax=Arundo donax TaxID=35708 RepID=A0A0A9FB13_ARUDO